MSMVSVSLAPKAIARRPTRAIMIRVQVQRRAGSLAIGSSDIGGHTRVYCLVVCHDHRTMRFGDLHLLQFKIEVAVF